MKNPFVKVGLHILVWVIGFLLFGGIFAYPKTIELTKVFDKWRLVDVIGTLFNVSLFYIILFGIHKRVLQFSSPINLLLKVLLIWSCLGAIEFLIDYNLILNYYPKYLKVYLFGLGLKLIIFTFLAFFFGFLFDRIQYIQLTKELEKQQIETELKFLKAQLSPHFLFNTLNNIYAVAMENSQDEIAENITKLSSLMRYMLYETNEKKIPLQKEITCIESLIELHKLRVDEQDKLNVEFTIEGNINGFLIPPMILIPIVENAFKYGFKTKKNSPISILLKTQNKEILFECRNRIFKVNNPIKEHSGIGLVNIEKRLTLIYGNHYSFDRKAEDGFFIVSLSFKNPL